MSRAKNLNAPENWQAWFRACRKDEWASRNLRVPSLAVLTGGDGKVLGAVAHCWAVYAGGDLAMQAGALAAIRALLPGLQTKCHVFACDLIAQQMEWHDRDRLWPLVAPDADASDVISIEIRAASNAEMCRALHDALADARVRAAFEHEQAARGEPS